jgi:hypothetical protein
MLYVCATAQFILCEREEAHAFLIPLFYCGSSDLSSGAKNVTGSQRSRRPSLQKNTQPIATPGVS